MTKLHDGCAGRALLPSGRGGRRLQLPCGTGPTQRSLGAGLHGESKPGTAASGLRSCRWAGAEPMLLWLPCKPQGRRCQVICRVGHIHAAALAMVQLLHRCQGTVSFQKVLAVLCTFAGGGDSLAAGHASFCFCGMAGCNC